MGGVFSLFLRDAFVFLPFHFHYARGAGNYMQALFPLPISYELRLRQPSLKQRQQSGLIDHRHFEFNGLVEL